MSSNFRAKNTSHAPFRHSLLSLHKPVICYAKINEYRIYIHKVTRNIIICNSRQFLFFVQLMCCNTMPILSGNTNVIYSCSHMKKEIHCILKLLSSKIKRCHVFVFLFIYLIAKRPCTDFFFNFESVLKNT